jgi:hypothetical protein
MTITDKTRRQSEIDDNSKNNKQNNQPFHDAKQHQLLIEVLEVLLQYLPTRNSTMMKQERCTVDYWLIVILTACTSICFGLFCLNSFALAVRKRDWMHRLTYICTNVCLNELWNSKF